MASTTLAVPAETLSGIAPGTSKCATVSGHKLILYKADDGTIKACENKCVHFGGSFAPDVEDTGKMKCTLHGMRLDPSTMKYVDGANPKLAGMTLKKFADAPTQPELKVTMNPDGSATLSLPEGGGGSCSLA